MQSTGSTVASNSPRPDQARSKAPVFVLGCPRSGTTLLYHMLLSAGNFAIYRGESQVFNLLEPRFGDLKVLRNRRKLLAAWEGSALFTRTGLDAGQVEAEVMDNCLNAGDFLRIVMDAMARKQGMERWADCTPEHLLFLQRIKETIPDALRFDPSAGIADRIFWLLPCTGNGLSNAGGKTGRNSALITTRFAMKISLPIPPRRWHSWAHSWSKIWTTTASPRWGSDL